MTGCVEFSQWKRWKENYSEHSYGKTLFPGVLTLMCLLLVVELSVYFY